jgi:hypothetical protein
MPNISGQNDIFNIARQRQKYKVKDRDAQEQLYEI